MQYNPIPQWNADSVFWRGVRGTALILAALLLWAGVGLSSVQAQDAQVQIIHNSADPAAEVVDIYLVDSNGNQQKLDNVEFRTARGFISVTPDTYDITIADSESTGPNDQDTATFTETFQSGTNYTVVANGVLDTNNFASNPDGENINFTLDIQSNAQPSPSGNTDGNVEIRAVHGATDAQTVDIQDGSNTTLFDDAKYGDITSYTTAGAGTVTLKVTPGDDSDNSAIATFAGVDLSGFDDNTLTVVASGFLDPSNQDPSPVADFTLIAVTNDGNVVDLGAGRYQLIHNAADPAASPVDIYVDGNKPSALDDVSFRSATAFRDIDSGVRDIKVADASSTGPNDQILATFEKPIPRNGTVAIIANGVLSPNDFEDNPNDRGIGFELLVKTGVRESAQSSDVEFFGVHGSTDAPEVDVRTRGGTTLLDNVRYTDISGYLPVSPGTYTLDVTVPNQNDIVASFEADLSGLGGSSAVVLASGFLTPDNDQDGPSFGLIGVLADGTVVEFSPDDTKTAEVQVVHNAAGFGVVDIYVLDPNGNKLDKLDDFPFRGSLVFDVPAGEDLEVTINGSGSSGSGDTQVASVSPVNLSENTFNQAFAVGEGSSDFELQLNTDQNKSAGQSGNVDLLVGHQSPDAPTVDVLTRGLAAVDGFSYKDFAPSSGYLSVPEDDYILRVGPDDNSALVGSFNAPLQNLGLGGSTLTVLASGFLDSNTNPAFGLVAVPPANTSTDADEVVEASNADQNVTELSSAPQGLLINEFFADVNSGQDANGDGNAGGDTEEQFVEIVNNSGSSIDVSNYKIKDGDGNEYTFPSNTSIPAGNAATIFTGGTPTNIPGFSDIGLPGLNNSSDDIILEDNSGNVLDQVTYSAFSPVNAGESTTRNPDFTGPAALTSTVNGEAFTPGETNDGSAKLPVELAGFDATVEDSDVILTWRTLSEQNNSGFAIQRRTGDSQFERVGFKEGQGTTTETTSYRYRVSDLEPGTHAFRLKQVDIDGTANFTDVTKVEIELDQAVRWSKVAPNPLSSTGTITMQVKESQEVRVALYDVLGRRIRLLHTGQMESGSSHTLRISGSDLPSGQYLLRAEGKTFTRTQRVTVVK